MTQRTYVVSGWLFLRLVGAAYLVAIVSFWFQADALIGPEGILPAASFLETVQDRLGTARWWQMPTLGWLSASPVFVHVLCGLGVLCALCVVFGVVQAAGLFVLWLVYLSLVTMGQDFMASQGDGLLLEVGFLAMLLAPLHMRATLNRTGPPSRVVLWLGRWLLFRLIGVSALVQLLRGEMGLQTLRALTTHYETQTLPTWIAWYAHQLPFWAHQAFAVAILVIQVLLPVCLCIPGRLQYVAFGGFVLLQGFLAATGNHGVLNVLAVALCLLLLDDGVLIRRWQKRLLIDSGVMRPRTCPLWIVGPVAALIVLVSGLHIGRAVGFRGEWPQPLRQFVGYVAPFRAVNAYDLFATPTNTRREIVLQGSRDGQTWQAYTFRWKPGELKRRPPFMAPHQPRLDVQMIVAAARDGKQPAWFDRLLDRLFEGAPAVLGLLRHNPFPDEPPRSLRAVLYEYRFTDTVTRRREGTWWQRKRLRQYTPVRSHQGTAG